MYFPFFILMEIQINSLENTLEGETVRILFKNLQ